MGNRASGTVRDASGSSSLQFHRVHGGSVRLSNMKSIALRVEGRGGGVTFSNRPIKPNEKIFLKILGLGGSDSASVPETGVLRLLYLGFTQNDPDDNRRSVPYSLVGLENPAGYWTNFLCERLFVGSIVHFWYTPGGEVHYGVNGDCVGALCRGVDTSRPLWMALDVDNDFPGFQILAVTRGQQVAEQPADDAVLGSNHLDLLLASYLRMMRRTPGVMDVLGAGDGDASDDASSSSETTPIIRRPRFTAPDIAFHATRGKNAELGEDKRTAWRTEGHNCNAYVFSSRPLVPGESIVIEVAQTSDSPAPGYSFGIGLTSCDPAKLTTSSLPDNPDELPDRSEEYWVVAKDAADSTHVASDTLSFMLCRNGDVLFWKNESPPQTVLKADLTAPLWMFFDICGPPKRIAVVGPLSLSQTKPDECIICSESAVNAVLSMCGHTCMCVQCACEQWTGRGNGECPLCRATITGVNKLA